MSRIADAFARARNADRAVFIPYITAGDPTLERSLDIVLAMAAAGADVIELGIPFSDPIADGPTNQRAAERALAAGASLAAVLEVIRQFRALSETAIVLFTYANPVMRYGIDRFAGDAAAAGVDGVLFTDVPVEELDRFRPALRAVAIDPILLVTPTSDTRRVRRAGRLGGGFLYLVSRTGVTGAQRRLDPGLEDLVRRVRTTCKLPVAVGFGISDADQVRQVAQWADGVVVGSAIVNQVAAIGDDDDLATTIEDFVRPLVAACQR